HDGRAAGRGERAEQRPGDGERSGGVDVEGALPGGEVEVADAARFDVEVAVDERVERRPARRGGPDRGRRRRRLGEVDGDRAGRAGAATGGGGAGDQHLVAVGTEPRHARQGDVVV